MVNAEDTEPLIQELSGPGVLGRGGKQGRKGLLAESWWIATLKRIAGIKQSL